jgi:hypothetical protein
MTRRRQRQTPPRRKRSRMITPPTPNAGAPQAVAHDDADADGARRRAASGRG